MATRVTSWRWALRLLVAAELLTALYLCAASAVETPVFGGGDEGYHLSYAVHLAEHGDLPVVGRTPVHDAVLAIQERTYPGAPPAPETVGPFRGTSYEAFQPPLYYVLAAPLTTLAEDWRDKTRIVRYFAVGLVVAAMGVLYVLCRLVRPAQPLPLYAAGLLPFLTPAFRQQEVLVSNDVLLVPLALVFACFAFRAASRGSLWALLGAAAVAGLLLLTKLTAVWSLLVLGLVALTVLLGQGSHGRRLLAAATVLVPGAVLAPWLLHNLRTYGALTANEVVLRLQAEVSPPTFPTWQEQPREIVVVLAQMTLGRQDEHPGWLDAAAVVAGLLLLALTLVALVRLSHGPASAIVLAAPLVTVIAMLCTLSVLEGTNLLYERYLHPVLPLAALAAVHAVSRSRPARAPARSA